MSDDLDPPAPSPPVDTRPWWRRYGGALALSSLPGLLAGVQLTGLLFFLNPHIPLDTSTWIAGVSHYAPRLGVASVLALAPFWLGRPFMAGRALAWALFVVFALAAAIDWLHASIFAFYLPPGINQRLIKAALLLSVAAVITFYTALLHSLHRRPYGRRSRWGLSILAVLSIYMIAERREAFRPRPQASPRASLVELDQAPPLLVVGIEGATLDAILPLAQRGQLPFFSELLETGATARIRTLEPTRREAAWTSLATGKYPYLHGVVGQRVWPVPFLGENAELRLLPIGLQFERWGVGDSIERAAGEFRRASTLWEVWSLIGIDTALVGWPASDPLPASLVGAYSEIDLARLPAPTRELNEASFGGPLPKSLTEARAADDLRLGLARGLLPSGNEGLTQAHALFLELPGLGEVSQDTFGGFSAVHFEGSQRRRDLEASQLLTSYYAHLDRELATLVDRFPEPRLLAVVSAYGTDSPEGLARLASRARGRGRLEGSMTEAPDGILLLSGPGIATQTRIPDLDLVDVVPTLLYAMGLPLARDLQGSLRTELLDPEFVAATPFIFLPSYETLQARPTPPPSSDSPAASLE